MMPLNFKLKHKNFADFQDQKKSIKWRSEIMFKATGSKEQIERIADAIKGAIAADLEATGKEDE